MAQGKKTGGRTKGTRNKRTLGFADYLTRRGLAVPKLAVEFFQSVKNPLLALEGLKDVSPMILEKLVTKLIEKHLSYKSLQLECIKTMAMYTHAKPKEVEVTPADKAATPETPAKRASTGALFEVVGGTDGQKDNASTGG
jgi:hypothetical protein